MTNNTEEYLKDIRELSGLQNAVLSGITVSKKEMTAEFFLVTDKAYTAEEEARAAELAGKYLPAAFSPRVKIVKRVPDEQILRRKIYEFMCSRFPAAAAFLKEEDVETELLSSGANFCFDVASGEQSLFSSGKILDEVSEYLQSVFCGSFYGNVRVVEKQAEELPEETTDTEEEIPLAARMFPVCGFRRIDGADELPKYATYIADVDGERENLVVCGSITYIQAKESKKGKTYYSLTVSDGTGSLRASYFPKKATAEKIALLKAGDKVVLIGANELYNGNLSYTAKKINYGAPPEGFVPEARKSRPVPRAYRYVFPEPYADYTQAGLFDNLEKPQALKERTFVVFDLETTGLVNQPSMGKMDKIIEIGAVKIAGGNVTEKFSSFVACPDRLSQEIVELTGIRDEDLAGAPTAEQVLADFYRFCDGCALVGHNVTFDYRFIRYYGEESGYIFDHVRYDTMTLAQELIRGEIANYKLNTIADYYGFTFNHHRAFDDALVTAKIFMELIKKRKSLP